MRPSSAFVADLDTLLPGAVPHVPCVSVSLSHRKDPGAGRERRGGARRCRGRVRGVGAVPPGSDVRYRGDPGGAAHSIGVGRRGIGGIMRKRLSAQRCWNPPMCRAGPSAHGSPSAENRRSRKTPESRGKPGIGSWGRSSPMCNTPAQTEKNPTRPRGSPPGARPVQAPREVVTPHHTHPGLRTAAPGEKSSMHLQVRGAP